MKFQIKHGLSDHPIYNVWCGIKQRCYNINDSDYNNYGGRGIKVHPFWMFSFPQFLKDMGPRPEGTTIDRKDNNGDYTPDNCRWATTKEQCRNTRVNRLITINGITKTLVDWIEETGISENTVKYRLRKGWTYEDAISKPINPCKSPKIRKESKSVS